MLLTKINLTTKNNSMKVYHRMLLHALLGHILISLLIFGVIFFFFKSAMEKQFLQTARKELPGIFKALYLGMQLGFNREELEKLLNGFQREGVELRLLEKKDLPKFDEGKEEITRRETKNAIEVIFHFRAKKDCLACHKGIKEGEILGALQGKFSYKQEMQELTKFLIFLYSFITLLILGGVYFIGKWQTKKMLQPLNLIGQKIQEAQRFSDLIESKELFQIAKTNLDEIDAFIKLIENYVNSVKKLAIDREVFMFELRLMEKFILTSEFIKDWKYHILSLFREINEILAIPFLFALFYVEDEIYDCEIFWYKKPSLIIKEKVEQEIKTLIKDYLTFNAINFSHNVLIQEEEIPSTIFYSLKTKKIILESPAIGGVVGVGVSTATTSETQEIAIEAVLTSLLNVIGSIKAITKYTKEIEFYATRDPLTHLYNQRVFWELLHYEIERATRYGYKFGLLILDIDNFKWVNDSFGHSFGDRVLQEIARTIENHKRKGDICCRYGGDEFTLILPHCDLEQAFSVAQRIKEAIANLRLQAPDNRSVFLTVSIGLVVFPEHGKSAQELFGLADTLLLQRAKAEGKDRIVFPTPQDITFYQEKQKELIFLLKEAVEKREIIPYFQPIYDLKSGEPSACEILMRLKINEEIMPAGKFIDLAESVGLVSTMDYINLEKALMLIKETNFDGYLFVNMSPKSLIISDFLSKMQQIIKKYNYPPDRIVFELTERETVKNLRLLQEFIKALEYYGFHFCIDDFGSGYSSFQYIKHFGVSHVKIEGEFVVGLAKDNLIDSAILESITALCKRLRIKMIAEFVENQEVIQKLRDLGVEYGQGFFLGKPSPSPQFPKLSL